jgi:hypothetical protein
LITLYLTPVVYTYMAALSKEKGSKKQVVKVADENVAAAR